ncbi:MAG: hypothetical protein F4X95_03410 [Oligoflexia bacterium]|nr:hypothetical protein [Oligoflexia bacterium]
MKLFYLVFFFFFIFFSCNQDQNRTLDGQGIPELKKLQADEQSLQDEIERLKKRLSYEGDTYEIEELQDEIDELEDKLKENRARQKEVAQEINENDFCQRTGAVRQLIMEKIKDGAINDEIEDCRDVTDFMISQITAALVLRVGELKAGDLDDLRGVPSIDLSNNKMSSLPSGIFDDLVSLEGDDAVKLTGNDFSSLPDGIFDNLKIYNKQAANYGLDILTEQLTEYGSRDEFDSAHDDSILPDLDVAKEPLEKTACDSYKGVCREDPGNDSELWTLRADCEKWEWDAVRYRHNEFKDYLNAYNGLTKPYLYEHFEEEFKDTPSGEPSYNYYKTEYESFKTSVSEEDERITNSQPAYAIGVSSRPDSNQYVTGKCSWPGNLSF